MNQLPFYTDINIELELIGAPAPKTIGKPVDNSTVRAAYKKMLDMNATLILLN